MICYFCHQDRDDVCETFDPYSDEEIVVHICPDCYQDRCDDI